ncbi:MAG: hydantoinase/oxoprolinase family protein, partial [Mesorhizobium sp.]
IVPPNPGVTSALGCLLVDVQHDFSESFMADASTVSPAEMQTAFVLMEEQAVERLTHEGVAREDMALQRTVEMMYQGQWRSLAVSAPARIESICSLIEAFHNEHEREFNYRREEAPVSIFRIAVKAIGIVPKAEMPRHEVLPHVPEPLGRRGVWFDGVSHDAAVYERDQLRAGAAFAGPAIVEQFDSTTVVPPGMSATVDGFLNILIVTKG